MFRVDTKFDFALISRNHISHAPVFEIYPFLKQHPS